MQFQGDTSMKLMDIADMLVRGDNEAKPVLEDDFNI